MRWIALVFLSFVLTSCGNKPAQKDSSESGITFVYISKCIFTMGDSESKYPDEKPSRSIELSPYKISDAEISNTAYVGFLNDAYKKAEIKITKSRGSPLLTVYSAISPFENKPLLYWVNSKGAENKPSWITFENNSFGVVGGKENLPVVAVTWYGAMSFAAHYGMRLPTEAEWECAARGGRNLAFPVQDIFNKDFNYYNKFGSPVKIRSSTPNPFKIYDMAGNVREWCLDEYDVVFYISSPRFNPVKLPTVTSTRDRVVRGGAFDSPLTNCRNAARFHLPPDFFDQKTGFRVVLEKSGT